MGLEFVIDLIRGIADSQDRVVSRATPSGGKPAPGPADRIFTEADTGKGQTVTFFSDWRERYRLERDEALQAADSAGREWNSSQVCEYFTRIRAIRRLPLET